MPDYISLGILVFVGITIFYGIIAIYDIPCEISKQHNHSQQAGGCLKHRSEVIHLSHKLDASIFRFT